MQARRFAATGQMFSFLHLLIRSLFALTYTDFTAFKTQQKNVFLVVFGLFKTIKASLIESKTSGHAI